jgi:hypoxanthine phosphoribosyltransferase
MSNVEVVAAVVGSCGTIGALAWAMLGNPSVVAWMRKRRIPISFPKKAAKRDIAEVKWKDIENAADRFTLGNSVAYDLVIGLCPDGVSLANLLASRLSARYAAIDKRYQQSNRIPFFVFDKDGHARSKRSSSTHFLSPPDVESGSRVLLVDGVTTFGNALCKAEEVVLKEIPEAQIYFYVFALDQARLSASHPEIVSRLSCFRCIDNFSVWLRFPWDPR